MEKKRMVVTIACVVLAAAVSGAAIGFSFGHALRAAVEPVSGSLREITAGQKRMESAAATLGTRLTALESEVKTVKELLAGPPPEDMNKIYDIPVADSYVLGPKDAPLTITVFQDFQCPFSAKFYPAALEGRKSFSDKVRVVVKHYPLPFHDMARPAAKAAMAAGEQGKFYELSDLILANQDKLTSDKLSELAKQTGLNMDQFGKDLKDKDTAYEKIIESDLELGGKVDVRGTPAFFLNGKKSASRTPEAWKAEIEAALKR